MYRQVLAFDYDGTLAVDGQVPPALGQALGQLQQAGFALFLVTGRQFGTVDLGPLAETFAGIAWENGAVLQHAAFDELYLPFGHVDNRLVEALLQANVPLEQGVAIVATWTPHEATVWRILSETGSETAVVHNKGALMILPPGTSKGTGLVHLLELCGYSPRNLVSFGDGENDLSLFQVSETGIAVADAVPSLVAAADLVMSQPGPQGVLEALQSYWLNGRVPPLSKQHERAIPLGTDEANKTVTIPGATLARSNLGIFGDSGSGKSWVTGLLVEGMHLAGYQVLLLDPEGDFRGLRSLPGISVLSGDKVTLPTPTSVVMLLEEASNSVVIDLCLYPWADRDAYIADLLHALRPLREHKFRPQWIVLEEAQHFLSPVSNMVSTVLTPMLVLGGWALVSYRPDRLDAQVLAAINHCVVTRLSETESVQTVQAINHLPSAELLANTPNGHIWLCDQRQLRLRSAPRRVSHSRHFYKYLDMPLPRPKRFYFHTPQAYLGVEAASLFEFKEILCHLPLESLIYHHTRGDFAAWVKGTLGDEVLASHLEKLSRRKALVGEALRQALLQWVTARYTELHALR